MPLLQHRKRRLAAVASLSLACLSLGPSKLWSRIQILPEAIDLSNYLYARVILRGVVSEVSALEGEDTPATASVARVQVERWYAGGSGSEAFVYFEIGFGYPGHNCIHFTPGTHWLIFAHEDDGHLVLVDDCYGAVAVSPSMASGQQNPDAKAQIEADFIAGLADADPDGRIISIQRLGGLRSKTSRPALHDVIEHGDSIEKDWATYAALRTGDITVLPRVREMLMRGEQSLPIGLLAWELTRLSDKRAIPGLIEILETVSGSSARQYALNALSAITNAQACTMDPGIVWTDDKAESKIRDCLTWWKEARR